MFIFVALIATLSVASLAVQISCYLRYRSVSLNFNKQNEAACTC